MSMCVCAWVCGFWVVSLGMWLGERGGVCVRVRVRVRVCCVYVCVGTCTCVVEES